MLTAEQLKAREGKMTSSIVAGALGLNPKMTPLDAWMRVTGKLPPMQPNKAIDRGNRLEELVLDYPCDELALVRKPSPFKKHPEFSWAGDSADALYENTMHVPLYIGEGKTVSGTVAKYYGDEGTDDIHPGALVQSHWHLIHWPEVDICLVPVLVGGYKFEFRLYYVRRDEEFEGALLEDAARWHRDYVVADKQPPTTDPRDIDNLLMLHPYPKHGLAEATAQLEGLVRAKESARLEKDEAKEREDGAKMRLIEILGDYEGSAGEDWRISFKRNKPSYPVDWEALAKSLGATNEQIAQYTKERMGNRPLRITIKEPK
jgi:predicted phage-related endonuclease